VGEELDRSWGAALARDPDRREERSVSDADGLEPDHDADGSMRRAEPPPVRDEKRGKGARGTLTGGEGTLGSRLRTA